MIPLLPAIFALAAAVPAAVPAGNAAEAATLLGAFSNWSAYSTGTGSDMVCYALSTPRASQPRGAKRDAVYVMVSDYPDRKMKAEPQIVPGFAYKAGAPASLAVGPDKFTFFTRNDGSAGKAWLQSLNDGQRLVDSMKGGVSAVALGTSAKGTRAVDTYSLAGFDEALAKIHSACGM
jgi:hypothetical protein